MRITGGRYLNRTVLFPKSGPGGSIRPSMDRMRQSIFNILGDLSGCSFLDLFAGSGIIGLEAASRGAEPVVLVEKDRHKRETVLKNLSWVETDIKLYSVPAESFVARCTDRFNIIFLDPPFRYGYKDDLVRRILDRKLLKEEGLLLIHHPKQEDWPESFPGCPRRDTRRYGQSVVEIYAFSAT
ncbi:MAG: 16S rRNA (guanine(966)-N(2))-methyltransferase RsmD [Spirochaetales bacterium]|nr:MAG: 16S rRNA (guanine(966)-N(2))-methyltransferase RsmD [Spirochaetales bacterium]